MRARPDRPVSTPPQGHRDSRIYPRDDLTYTTDPIPALKFLLDRSLEADQGQAPPFPHSCLQFRPNHEERGMSDIFQRQSMRLVGYFPAEAHKQNYYVDDIPAGQLTHVIYGPSIPTQP
jgi:hypothetical protein